MLTDEQREARKGKLTASMVAPLMGGTAEEIHDLWREMIGDPTYERPDLSDNDYVQIGVLTEPLNLYWVQKDMGPITRRGEVVIGPKIWMAATLDGWIENSGCPVECKTVGGREPLERVTQRYKPQMHWQMLVCKVKVCAFSVLMRNRLLDQRPEIQFIELDEPYANELSMRAAAFMLCVETLTPPTYDFKS